MSETKIPEQEPLHSDPERSLTEEFTNLGRNLIDVLQAAWERPERQKLQHEIENGLIDLGGTLRREAKAVSESPVTQRVKTEVEDLGSRVRNAQIEAKVRQELISALHIMNKELAKVANVLSTSGPGDTVTSAEKPEQSETQGTRSTAASQTNEYPSATTASTGSEES